MGNLILHSNQVNLSPKTERIITSAQEALGVNDYSLKTDSHLCRRELILPTEPITAFYGYIHLGGEGVEIAELGCYDSPVLPIEKKPITLPLNTRLGPMFLLELRDKNIPI